MELTLPVYVEVSKEGRLPIHFCRPLFSEGPSARDAQLGLAMSKLNRKLKLLLDHVGKDSQLLAALGNSRSQSATRAERSPSQDQIAFRPLPRVTATDRFLPLVAGSVVRGHAS